MTIISGLGRAIFSLSPTATWTFEDDDYETLVWEDGDATKPSQDELVAELERLGQAEIEADAVEAEAQAVSVAAYESAVEKLSGWGLTPAEIAAIIPA
jgi:hypothetical protein